MTSSGAQATATATGGKKKKKSKDSKAKAEVPAVNDNAGISGAPEAPPGHQVVAQEERVEFRDQDGNLLNEEQVKELEGKVEFKTRYETRTRVIDADGNEVHVEGEGEQRAAEEVAPPHPDVEGVDPNTKNIRLDDPIPKEAAQSVEGEREKVGKEAKPGSEGSEATQGEQGEAHEEL